ncbi:hypothetical protein A3K64_02930 [Candidatus Micrarchaeota archaeon RBG_16_36_9]|nr:MAG: hypothetical protein A3K64_02930 [Candidatus Micrarchaeota archaeon RBG_16_36_9]
MAEYYLDIETAHKNKEDINSKDKSKVDANLNPETGKIVTIQFQQLDTVTGRQLGELEILKEWDSSEKDIVENFGKLFLSGHNDGFIPIGMNLGFEFKLLISKFKEHLAKDINPFHLFYVRKFIDIKPILVIANGGGFQGCNLHNFTGKDPDGWKVPRWYYDDEHDKITDYVIKEAEEFIKLYKLLKNKIPEFLKPVKV